MTAALPVQCSYQLSNQANWELVTGQFPLGFIFWTALVERITAMIFSC